MEQEEASQDSGLESPVSKSETPELNSFMSDAVVVNKEEPQSLKKDEVVEATFTFEPKENYDDEPDETLGERLWGLTEMLPDCVVNGACRATSATLSGVKSLYSFSRTALWIAASTSVILFAPVFFELEIAKIEEKQKSEQKQYLLGPSAAMIGSGATPPMPR